MPGRARELARLVGWVTAAVAGRGRAVLVEGEPGIGKSALVRAACATARDLGGQVFWGAGDELGQELPLLPLTYGLQVRERPGDPRRATIAGLLRGELTAGKGVDLPAAAAEQLLALIDEVCAAGPTVLVVDDLQWADEATVALWRRIAQSVRQLPLLLVGAMRPVPQRDCLLALRAAVDPGDRIRLGRLPDAAAAELVANLAGGTPGEGLLRLADGAAGNPLYLTELVDALARGDCLAVNAAGVAEVTVTGGRTPSSLAEAIADRLGFLPKPVREVLRVAALLGVDFSVSDLATVSAKGVAELLPALDEARAAGVLTATGHDLAFRHPLIRSALYEQMPASVRAAWHRDAGRKLVEAGAPVDRVARQLLPAVCGPGADRARSQPLDGWVLAWLMDAAQLLTGHSPRAAVELLRRATTAPPATARQRDLLACRLSEALYRVGAAAEAAQVAAAALAHVADLDLLVDLHWTLAQCRAIAGRSDESIQTLTRALADRGLSPKHRARLLVLSARMHRDVGRIDVACRAATEALRAGTDIGDEWTVGWALHVLTLVAMMRGETAEALPLFERALAVARAEGLIDLRLLLLINHAVTLGDLDRYEEAFAAGHEVRNLADHTGSVVRLVQAHSALGQLLLETGQWDDALVEIDVLPEDLKDPSVVCCDRGVAAIICFHRGDVVAGRRHVATAAPAAERIERRVVAPYALARSLELEQAGAPAEALAVLTAAVAYDTDVEELLVDTVRLAVLTGSLPTAQAATAQVEALAAAADIPHRRAAALFCRGLLDSDPTQLLRAAERYQDAGRPLPRAQALEAAAVAFAGSDASSAQAAFTRALAGYTALSAGWDTARMQARFRPLGIRRSSRIKHRRPRHGWESLTPTEGKIAAMVAEGMSNPKIASQLFLSPRTVATHVSHILTKLQLHSRIDVAREAGRRYSAS
jgi:DNA-binding CsgD family transcriptional regulator/tetratricopeptide (TPR) repeat protein